jgi:hypothetical protein
VGACPPVRDKQVYLAGLAANLLSMVLLIVSSFFTSDQPVAYGLLLAATACLGVGFGLTAPALNTFTAVFHPAAVDRSVLVLNALLGLGTAPAPVFVGLGLWWGLPAMSVVLLSLLLAVSLPMPLRAGARVPGEGRAAAGISARFWIFAAFAVPAPGPSRTPASASRPSTGPPRWRPWSWAGCPSS